MVTSRKSILAATRPTWLVAGALALPLLGGTVLAQDQFMQRQGDDVLRSDWLVGADVVSEAGEQVGTVNGLLVGPDGSLEAAVLEVGGFLGIGGKLIAVDWSEFDVAMDAREVTIALSEEQADNAPEFTYRDRAAAAAETTGGTNEAGGMNEGIESGAGTGSDAGSGSGSDADTGTGTDPETGIRADPGTGGGQADGETAAPAPDEGGGETGGQ